MLHGLNPELDNLDLKMNNLLWSRDYRSVLLNYKLHILFVHFIKVHEGVNKKKNIFWSLINEFNISPALGRKWL